MKTTLRNEQGAVLIIEVVVLAAVLAAAGLAGYQYISHKSAANQATNPKPHVVAKASPAPANEITVTELGFKMTLPAGLSDLKYVAQTNLSSSDGNGAYSRASFSTSSLEQKGAASTLCLAAHAPLGAIARYNAEPKGLDSGVPVRKVGSFYLTYSGAQSACSDNNGAPSLESSQARLLRQAFDNATPTPPPAHSASEAKALVERLWNGYNVNTVDRTEVEANSTADVKAYIEAGGQSSPINCTQNNGYRMTYSDPLVNGTTARVTVTQEGKYQVQVSVDLNSLLISKIDCLPTR